ncbi:MAG: hypothetical protein E6Q32_05000 [Neisseriales bacterium]|nr:MAG: hypothetical protein E6Q32_05000 [Neisseriales bacterium]
MKQNLIMLSLLTIIISACNGGGGGSSGGGNTPVNNFPTGRCATTESGNGGYLSPTIFPTQSYTGAGYLYINGFNFPEILYSEYVYATNTESTIYFDAHGDPATQTTLGGACSMGTIYGNSSYASDVIYYTNCTSSVTGHQLTFSANYGIYLASQYPGSGTPLKSGILSFSCTLQ